MRNGSENKINLVLIRHGLTWANEAHKYCGRKDDTDLSDGGIEEIIKNKEAGVYPDADIVYTSVKKRAKHTAQLIYPDAPKTVIDEFDEMDFGDFEGKTHEDLKDTEEYKAWIDSNGELPFPGGESREVFIERTGTGYKKLLKELQEKRALGEDFPSVAVVAHGGTIMAILNGFGKEGYFESLVRNASGFLCEVDVKDPYSIKVIRKLQGAEYD